MTQETPAPDLQIEAMIDLETLGVGPKPVILSIGVALFNQREGLLAPDRHLSIRVDAASCLFAGLVIDKSTLEWWSGQTHEARAAVTKGPSSRIADAIGLVDAHLRANGVTKVWAHGAATDLAWLQSACGALSRPVPWGHRAPRDTRTLFDLASLIGWEPAPLEKGVAHVALDDAIAQARDVLSARAAIYEAFEADARPASVAPVVAEGRLAPAP